MGLANWLQERRHRRGFGIHSPFGFFVVNEIVRDPQAYYAYDRLEGILTPPGEYLAERQLFRRVKFIHRLVGRLAPQSVIFHPGLHPAFGESVTRGDSRATFGKLLEKSLEISLHNSECKTLALHRGMLVVFDPEPDMLDKVVSMMSDGLVLYSRKCILAIRRPGMAHVAYSCKF